MDFLKKNYGLLLSAVICTGVIVLLLFMCVSQRKMCEDYRRQIKSTQDAFRKVNASGMNVKNDDAGELVNLNILEANIEKVNAQYDLLRKSCIAKYKITPDPNTLPTNNPTLAREMIENRLASLENRIAVNKLHLTMGGGQDAKFGNEIRQLFLGGRQIKAEEVMQTFRLMELYDRLLSLIINSGIKNVPLFGVTCQFEVIKREGYSITPLQLTVEGTAEQLQHFFNSLSHCDNTFFNVKSFGIEFKGMATADSIFSKYFLLRYGVKYGGRSEADGKIASFGGNTKLLRASRIIGPGLGSITAAVTAKDQNRTVVESSGSKGRAGMEGWVNEEIKRQDFLVYREERIYRMDLNVDIIEFFTVVEEE